MRILFICNAPYINIYRVSDVNKKKLMLSNFRNLVSTLNKTGNSENFYVEKYLTAVLNCITNYILIRIVNTRNSGCYL